MKRRAFVVSFVQSALVVAFASTLADSRAQRPAHPIARPPRPGGAFGPGRFPGASDGVVRPIPPGTFVVRTVNAREKFVQLSDADGRTARVLVDPGVFDLKGLRSGDEVLVDFVVPTSANAPLRAAGMWPK